jgi:hypothetical protein
MGDIDRDPELDRGQPDPRSDLERVVGADSEGAEAQDGGSATRPIPLDPTGAEGVGEVKNQDKTAQ